MYMKRLSRILFISALFGVLSCVDADFEEPSGDGDAIPRITEAVLPDLTAGFADDQTKTYVEGGKYLRWHEDDRITAFFGNTLNRQYRFSGKTGDNSGSFVHVPSGNLETGNKIDRIYAVYPYDKDAKLVEEGQIHLSFPAVQSYTESSFGKGANTMVAVTEDVEDTFLAFKNACGYLKLRLYGTGVVKRMELKGNQGEKIAGEAVVVPVQSAAPEVTMSEDATDVITLDCGEGVTLSASSDNALEFWIVLPATTFENGISITVETAGGKRYSKCTNKTIIVERNAVQPMAALSFPGNFFVEGANVIEYTATKQLESSGYLGDAEIISDFYNPNTRKGLIICDRPITMISSSAFSNMWDWDETNTLLSMRLPETVTHIGNNAFSHCHALNRLYLTSLTPPTLDGKILSGNGLMCDMFVPTSAYEDYLAAGYYANAVLWPYDYEAEYPDIPDNEIWYTSDDSSAQATPDQVSSWTVKENSFDPNTFRGKIVLDAASIYILYDEAFNNTYNNRTYSVILPKKLGCLDCSVFYGWEGLKYVYAPKGVSASTNWSGNTGSWSRFHAFRGCTALTEYVGGCASADGCFMVCGTELVAFIQALNGMTSYNVPEGIKKIGPSAFQNCSELVEINLPATLTYIEDDAFMRCGFKKVVIPDAVTTVSSKAFYSCMSLETVYLGSGVRSLSDSFSGCTALKEVYCKSQTPPTITAGVFDSASEELVIYVPEGSSPAYKMDTKWGTYRSKIKEIRM